MTSKGHYSVAPRYTCGSPAQVPLQTAQRVAREEERGYRQALTGLTGAEDLQKAQKLGLRGIVEHRVEVKHGWRVEDMCTDERFDRLTGILPRIGDEVIEDDKSTRLFVESIDKHHIGLAYARHGTIAVAPSPGDFKRYFTIIRKVQT